MVAHSHLAVSLATFATWWLLTQPLVRCAQPAAFITQTLAQEREQRQLFEAQERTLQLPWDMHV